MAPVEFLRVQIVYCPRPGSTDLCELRLPEGSLLSDALAASDLVQRHGLQADELKVGIWSRARELTTPLRDLDRVEIYRPLQVDPKEARRLRYKRDRVRKVGAAKAGETQGR